MCTDVDIVFDIVAEQDAAGYACAADRAVGARYEVIRTTVSPVDRQAVPVCRSTAGLGPGGDGDLYRVWCDECIGELTGTVVGGQCSLRGQQQHHSQDQK